jgi:hypothetical protein
MSSSDAAVKAAPSKPMVLAKLRYWRDERARARDPRWFHHAESQIDTWLELLFDLRDDR